MWRENYLRFTLKPRGSEGAGWGGWRSVVWGVEARQDWDKPETVHCVSLLLLCMLEVLHVKCQKSVFYLFSSLDHNKVIFFKGGSRETQGRGERIKSQTVNDWATGWPKRSSLFLRRYTFKLFRGSCIGGEGVGGNKKNPLGYKNPETEILAGLGLVWPIIQTSLFGEDAVSPVWGRGGHFLTGQGSQRKLVRALLPHSVRTVQKSEMSGDMKLQSCKYFFFPGTLVLQNFFFFF